MRSWVRQAAWQAIGVATLVMGCSNAPPLPVLGEVPSFDLVDHRGARVTRDDFIGAPWVAAFIFTRCTLVCPRMSERMRLLERAHKGTAARFVSVSVDPEHDTTEVLHAYAERLQAGERWSFLTGDPRAIGRLSIKGFKLGFDVSADPDVPASERVVHSDRLVLVDAMGQIRGYYDAFEPGELDRITRDLASLLP